MTRGIHQATNGRSCTILSQLRTTLDGYRLGDLLLEGGKITGDQLDKALKAKKDKDMLLGEVLCELGFIKRSQLFMALGRQYILRVCATFLFFICLFAGFEDRRARAELSDAVLQVHVSQPVMPVVAHIKKFKPEGNLFGASEKRSWNLRSFTKWTGMFERFDQEMKNPADIQLMRKWHAKIGTFKNMELMDMASSVNRLVNKQRYISDAKNWGKSDYWATPTEFLKKGGDCEDFAITKYTALRALGVPQKRLRLAVVHDNVKDIPHAVLVVYTDQGPYILDNQNDNMVSANGESKRYRPIFSINQNAWWLHTGSSNSAYLNASSR